MFRRMLEEQIALVEEGQDPMNTYRNEEENRCIVLPMEHYAGLVAYETGTATLARGPNNPLERFLDQLMGKTPAR